MATLSLREKLYLKLMISVFFFFFGGGSLSFFGTRVVVVARSGAIHKIPGSRKRVRADIWRNAGGKFG